MYKSVGSPKRLLLSIFIFTMCITGFQIVQSSEKAASVKGPEIIAIKFHADWCGYCKEMGPVFKELQAKFDQQPVLYVTFDHTREYNRIQSQYMAEVMGLSPVWKKHGGSTGFILLIDAETKQIKEKLTHDQGLKEMGAALQEAVKQVS